LAPQGKYARWIWSGSIARYEPICQIKRASTISLIGLRGRYIERRDFLIATIPPANELANSAGSSAYFPHFADSGGYQTQFIFLSGTTAESAGSLRLFSDFGTPLRLNP
jgi:hypothetical protein